MRNREPLAHALATASDGLSERERYIVEHRLLADAEARGSLREVGRRFGVSRERARQLESALKHKLRARLAPIASGLELNAA